MIDRFLRGFCRASGSTMAGAFCLLIGAIAMSPPLPAQSPRIDTIFPKPDPVVLRRIWSVRGAQNYQRVGDGVGSVGDINGDSLQDFAVLWGTVHEWRVFLGSREQISTTPFQVFGKFNSMPPAHPVVGDFRGTGHNLVGFPTGTIGAYRLYLYGTESNRIDTVPWAILRTETDPSEVIGEDLDGDGDDELIMFAPTLYPEVRIYEGGPDFQVDTPTLIIRDNTEIPNGGGPYTLIVGRMDDDPYIDVATWLKYSDYDYKLKVWFGSAGSPWNWSIPDRTVLLGEEADLASLDCDGDGILDFAVYDGRDGIDLFRSDNGKSLRDRPMTIDDADVIYRYIPLFYTSMRPMRLGYLNDSTHRYEMLAMQAQGPSGVHVLGLSGGPNGPDGVLESRNDDDVLFAFAMPIGDVNGDGYDDLIAGWPGSRPGTAEVGEAAIFSGGAYIPHDFTATVRQIAIAGRTDAVSLWPNPVGDELHITWQHDLPRMPSRFVVHDLLGRSVASGMVDPSHGGMLWQCAGVRPGMYVLRIYDADGNLLAAERMVKQ